MLKKALVISLVFAAAVSPFLPKVFADNASWKTLMADRVWNQAGFRVDRLVFPVHVSEPSKRGGVAYVTNTAADCTDPGTCTKIDVSVLRNGQSQTIANVDQSFLNASFALAQNGKFVTFTKSSNNFAWGTVSFVDPNTGEMHSYATVARKPNELSFISFATSGDRLFATILQSDTNTKDVQSTLLGMSTDGVYEERNINAKMRPPMQRVVDVYNDQVLIKFEFPTGYKQLALVNPKTQVMSTIPDTWTEPQADILFAHLQSNGQVVFFRNYHMYTYNPATPDVLPVSHALLNWNEAPQDVVRFYGDYMAWVDDQNQLWIQNSDGSVESLTASSNTSIDPRSVHLSAEGLLSYRENVADGKYHFLSVRLRNDVSASKSETTEMAFLITDTYRGAQVGTDVNNNIWYAQGSTMIKLGFGSSPIITDERHVVWKGTDGTIYQATLSAYLSMPMSDKTFNGLTVGTRVKAIGDARVFLVGNDGQLHWIVSETVANSLFGSIWNQGIVEVEPTFLWRFGNGTNVDANVDMKTL